MSYTEPLGFSESSEQLGHAYMRPILLICLAYLFYRFVIQFCAQEFPLVGDNAFLAPFRFNYKGYVWLVRGCQTVNVPFPPR